MAKSKIRYSIGFTDIGKENESQYRYCIYNKKEHFLSVHPNPSLDNFSIEIIEKLGYDYKEKITYEILKTHKKDFRIYELSLIERQNLETKVDELLKRRKEVREYTSKLNNIPNNE